ncbi:Mediator of RNA polymerase II transcription subunit 27 [Glycine max]|nr:Mediator of RNA polymerase II transcription subunit 27 [Glycine max]KAH1192696.1 Mediator of RNA polymerase II transcription subunit 27 [Glycine max]
MCIACDVFSFVKGCRGSASNREERSLSRDLTKLVLLFLCSSLFDPAGAHFDPVGALFDSAFVLMMGYWMMILVGSNVDRSYTFQHFIYVDMLLSSGARLPPIYLMAFALHQQTSSLLFAPLQVLQLVSSSHPNPRFPHIALPLPPLQQPFSSLPSTPFELFLFLQLMQMQQTQQQATATPFSTCTPPPSSGGSASEAPPKQVAQAMDKLGQAERIIADIRIGADRLLEALFVAAAQPHQGNKPLQVFLKEDACMRQYLQDLRSLGKELEESGVLSESVRSRKDFWGLHMPLVCPDGAVVAYAWKRQLAGQAGASAVDRTRLALKAFTDQKRRFFPHLDDGLETSESASKKCCGSEEIAVDPKEGISFLRTLPDVLKSLEKDVPNLKILTFERLDWLKRASTLTSSTNENSLEHNYHGSNKLRLGSVGTVPAEKVAVIELLFPCVFRAVISLHPAGSMDPDAVAFFAPDESGSYVHARGFSVHHVFRHITEYAATALQYFLGNQSETTGFAATRHCFQDLAANVPGYLQWINNQLYCYPPVHRPYWQFSFSKILLNISSKDQNSDTTQAYHIDCLSEET